MLHNESVDKFDRPIPGTIIYNQNFDVKRLLARPLVERE